MPPVAYPPIRQASWPAAPHWHPPAMELDVVYPLPGPYARRKDVSVRGSLSYTPFLAGGFYGADPAPATTAAAATTAAPAATAATAAPAASNKKPVGQQIKQFFRKDESGESKAEKVAKRAVALARKPEPVVVPPPPPPSSLPLVLTGVAALVVGVGVGYMISSRA